MIFSLEIALQQYRRLLSKDQLIDRNSEVNALLDIMLLKLRWCCSSEKPNYTFDMNSNNENIKLSASQNLALLDKLPDVPNITYYIVLLIDPFSAFIWHQVYVWVDAKSFSVDAYSGAGQCQAGTNLTLTQVWKLRL